VVTAALIVLLNAGVGQASHTAQAFSDVTLSGGGTQWAVLDALPSGDPPDFSPRTVHLTFDIAFDGNSSTVAPLRIIANGMTVLDTTFAHSGTQAYPGVVGEDPFPAGARSLFGLGRSYSLDLAFPLVAVPDCCTDIFITVDQPDYDGANPLVLSSIVLDWSQPIPEPGTAILLAVGLVVLTQRRRGSWHVEY
jgi:hypothetical protein